MFTEALFTTAKTWKQPKFLLMDDWVRCIIQSLSLTHTHTMEYYLAVKRMK